MAEPQRRDRLIVAIGVLKLMKAIVLVAAAATVFATLHGSFRTYVRELAAGSGRELITKAVGDLTGSSPHKVELIGTLLVVYAALFTVEGLGLLARRVWAEWLTIIITCSFIPLEVYEVIVKGSPIKALVLVLNILIAIYLIGRRLHAHHRHGLVGWLRERFGS
ncbi:MAG: DUF2127 domain-containing protein [Kofleriaceae bacterium]